MVNVAAKGPGVKENKLEVRMRQKLFLLHVSIVMPIGRLVKIPSDRTYKNIVEQVNDGYFMDKGFMSASTVQSNAANFVLQAENRNIVEFIIEANGKGGAMTNNYVEAEVLFKSGTRFSAKSKIITKEFKFAGKRDVLQVTLKEL